MISLIFVLVSLGETIHSISEVRLVREILVFGLQLIKTRRRNLSCLARFNFCQARRDEHLPKLLQGSP